MFNPTDRPDRLATFHPDIVSQFAQARYLLESYGCQVVSTTEWSLMVRVVKSRFPGDVPNAIAAGQWLAQMMATEGWPDSSLKQGSFNDEVFVLIPYNLSIQ